MGLLENIKKMVENVPERYLEPEVEEGTDEEAMESEVLSVEQMENCIVEGDVEQTAQKLLEEAVAELNQSDSENTIYAVKDCVETMGTDSDPVIITKMIKKVAKKDPKILKQDGEARLVKIGEVMQMMQASMEQALKETAACEQQIAEAESQAESSCIADVSELNKQCEEDIRRLRENLQKNIETRGKQRDAELEELKGKRADNEKLKAEAKALNRAVVDNATVQQNEIKLYLSKLQVEE